MPRLLRHEWTRAVVGAVLLAVVMTWLAPPVATWVRSAGESWPGIADPTTTIAGDLGDPTLQAWQVAWIGHAVRTDPAGIWDTNAFYPEPGTLAFSDSLLGYLPAGLVGTGPVAAVLRYNALVVLAFALAALGAYALVRQLGAGRVAGVVAAVAFAYAPHRYGHLGHLNVLSSGGIPLALAMLARGHGWSLRLGYSPDRVRPGWAAAGWATAAWQVSLGFGLGIPFAYVLGTGCVVAFVGWLVAARPGLPRRLVVTDAVGTLGFAAVCGLLALPYLRTLAAHPESRRAWDYVALFSPPPRGFTVAPADSFLWGPWQGDARDALGNAANEKALLCGIALYGLAALGLVLSVWTVRQRVLLAVGVLVSGLLALGPEGPLYWLLYDLLPGFDGSRTPGRLVLWTSLLLAVLAAGAVSALAERARGTDRVVAALGAVALVGVVAVEGLPNLGHPTVPPAPAALAVAPAPLVVLPSDVYLDNRIQLWATDRFPPMVNGGSGVNPSEQAELRETLRGFPDAASVAALRAIGVRGVVVLAGSVADSDFAGALRVPPPELGLTPQVVDGDVLYDLG